MSQYKDVAVGSTVYFWFAANTTAGAAGDGATPLYDVRLAGASASAAPTASGSPTLLTHANYTDGLHEIAIDTTGYSNGEYAVFCTLTISSVNPAGFCGSFVVRSASSTLYDVATAIKAKTDNLPTDPADASDIASSFTTVNGKLDTIDDFLDTEVAAIKAKTDNLPSDPADASDIASSFTTVNSKLDTIDDLLDTEIAAIKTVVDTVLADTNELQTDWADGGRLDLILDTRASQTSVNTIDDFLDTEVAAIKAKTDNLPASPAAVSDIPTAAAVADKVLGRNIAGGSDGGRTVAEALYPLRNKVDLVSAPGFMVVTETDDTTEAWRAALTTSASADAITSIDPT